MPQFVKFRSNSVAVRIRSPELWAGLDRLRTERGMNILNIKALRAIPATVPTCGGECVLQASGHDRKSLLRRGKTLANFSKLLLKASSKYQNHISDIQLPCGPSPPPCLLVAGSAFCKHRNMIENHCSEGGRPSHFFKALLKSSSKHPKPHRKTTSKIIDQKGEDSRKFFQTPS